MQALIELDEEQSKESPRLFSDMAELRKANAANGYYWFSPDTMKFFESRIESALYSNMHFVTSEKPPYAPRRYTVRHCTPKATIETSNKDMAFASLTEARAFAKNQELPESWKQYLG